MALIDDLDQLTGEEIYHLLGALNEAICSAYIGLAWDSPPTDKHPPLLALATELQEVEADVRVQVARITIPMKEASAIVWRARYARGHPVRVVTP